MDSQQSSKDGDLHLGAKNENPKSKEDIKTDIMEGYDMLEDEFVQDMLQGHDHTITDDYVDSPSSPPPEVVEANKCNNNKKNNNKKKRKGFWKLKRNKDKKEDDKEDEEKDVMGKVDDGYVDIAKDFVFKLLDISGISGKLTGPTAR
ncbi:hypothetical protein MCOR25_000497 [Pyricularia grisea]|nr:hypothetical protein MCOR25_000497 [Pyricularia grisea]